MKTDKNFFLSIINKGYWYDEEEMLIPKKLGEPSEKHPKLNRLDRVLPVGHRFHGYEF